MLKRSRNIIILAGLLAAVLGGGCGGASGSYSASPASFLVPGLMQLTPPTEMSPAAAQTNAIPSQIARR